MSDEGLRDTLGEALAKTCTALEYGGNHVIVIGAVISPDGSLVVKAHITEEIPFKRFLALVSGVHYQLHQTLKQAAEQ